ncbi:MAG: hypothetical protein M0Z84_14835 [Gammaproteobacteria bacterium]|nr:hypothetical protein [Gammaproteobacteria bacterium]
MALQFVLPTLGPTAPKIDVAETERWIASLPVLNAAETSHRLFIALSALNRLPVDDRTRLQLLELYRRPVQVVGAEQQKRYLGLPVPLPQDGRLVAERVRQFQVELAHGYKRVALGLSENGQRDPEATAALAMAVQRAIRALTLALARSYELYAPGASGTWHEIHMLYRFTESQGITDTPVADELNTAGAYSSVGHAYKQALLFGLSDPHHLPAQLLQKIDRYLDVYASLAQLTGVTAALKPECQFLVDLENDRAGSTNIGDMSVIAGSRYRLLATVDLVRTMHQQLSALRNGERLQPDALGRDFYANRGAEMLTHLITSWGLHPKRHFPRTPKSGAKTEIVRGIANIGLSVNGGTPFIQSTTQVGPQPARTETEGQTMEPPVIAPVRTDIGEPWNLLDESAGGFSLESPVSPGKRGIQVGELFAVHMAGRKAGWGIAVARWVRVAESGRIEIGAQRLAPSAVPVAIALNDAPESHFALALRLPEIRPLRQAQTLITSCGSFKPQRMLILDDGYRTHRIRAVRLVNLTGSFEQFEFEFLG